MADVRPFRGLYFASSRAPLSRVLCPPYDVIGPEQARRLRREALNAVHLELPEGSGARKYRNAARTLRRWIRSGVLVRDEEPAFYVCEERFRFGGRLRRRLGFLAALGVSPSAAKAVLRHERTLAKPKADRLRLLKAVRANTSPVFGIFPDARKTVRRALAFASRSGPLASGTAPAGARYRLWRLSDPRCLAVIRRSLARKSILIADGHHRYEASRRYWESSRSPALETTLAYLCPEEDAGLIVLPTHRIAGAALAAAARRTCRLRPCRSRPELLRRLERCADPYAFGLCREGHWLAVPKSRRGCRSGLCVEWLARVLLRGLKPERILYTPDAAKACALAKKLKGAAVFVKPFRVSQIRRAVRAVGLLPPKSTYFYPKIATGLAFKPLERALP